MAYQNALNSQRSFQRPSHTIHKNQAEQTNLANLQTIHQYHQLQKMQKMQENIARYHGQLQLQA